jgi:hypothetical protein
MRRFRQKQADSLELLLDTICNAFGGIVLITILITLLTRDAERSREARDGNLDRELIERQIASLESDIDEARKFIERHGQEVSVDPALAAQLGEAKRNFQTAKGKNEEAWTAWKGGAAKAAGEDPETNQALGEKVSLQSKLAQAATEHEALDQKRQRLEDRFAALSAERKGIIADKAEALRLPKEGSEGHDVTYFILRYNKVFPVFVLSGSSWVRNKDYFDWRDEDDGFEISPKSGSGIPVRSLRPALSETIQRMKLEGSYAAIILAPDSVEAFRSLKNELLSAGVKFGWKFKNGDLHAFGSNGSNPPPL